MYYPSHHFNTIIWHPLSHLPNIPALLHGQISHFTKMWLCGGDSWELREARSLRNGWISGKFPNGLCPPPPTVGQFGPLGCQINSTLTFVICCIRVDVLKSYHHDWTSKRQQFYVDPVARRASGRPPGHIFGPKICIFLRYTYETPIFSAQTDPTQWDYISPLSWGNSG